MSEVRVVLLGNNCSLKISVGNMILGENCLDVGEPDRCQRVSTATDNKQRILINTPNLQHPNLCGEKVTEFVEDLRICCGPGPHVFLLVLQPEKFTKEQKERLKFILQLFNSPHKHILAIISAVQKKSSGVREKYLQDPLLGDILSECKYEFMRNDDLPRTKLWGTISQIQKENNGEYVSLHKHIDPHLELPTSHGSQKQEKESRLKFGGKETEMTSVIHLVEASATLCAHSGFSNVTGDGIVKKEKLQEVAGNNRWRVNNSLDEKYKPLSPNTIVKKACSRVGASLKYSLTEYNCEHFATELRYGKAESRQVQDVQNETFFEGLVAIAAGIIAGVTMILGVHRS